MNKNRQDTSFGRNRHGVNAAMLVLENFPVPHSDLPGGLSRLPDFGFYKLHLHDLKKHPLSGTHQFE